MLNVIFCEKIALIFDDTQVLEEIVEALKPIEAAVLKLSEISCNLMVADGVLRYLLQKLDSNSGNLSKMLYKSVQKRIDQRRNKTLVSSLLFLHHSQYPFYNALLTIQATSTITERVFSVAGIFKTKIRNRMQSKNLNILVFLKYYFLRSQK